jgi:hypothetical protein
MEERELNQRLHVMFKEMLLVLESAKEGFLTGNQTTLTEAETKLTRILTSNFYLPKASLKRKQKMKLKKSI